MTRADVGAPRPEAGASGEVAHGGVIVGPSGKIVAWPPAAMAQTAVKPSGPALSVNGAPGGTIKQSRTPTVSSAPSMVAVAEPSSARKTSSSVRVCGGLDSPGASVIRHMLRLRAPRDGEA